MTSSWNRRCSSRLTSKLRVSSSDKKCTVTMKLTSLDLPEVTGRRAGGRIQLIRSRRPKLSSQGSTWLTGTSTHIIEAVSRSARHSTRSKDAVRWCSAKGIANMCARRILVPCTSALSASQTGTVQRLPLAQDLLPSQRLPLSARARGEGAEVAAGERATRETATPGQGQTHRTPA